MTGAGAGVVPSVLYGNQEIMNHPTTMALAILAILQDSSGWNAFNMHEKGLLNI